MITSYASLAATLKANGLTLEEVENIGELARSRKRQGLTASQLLSKEPDGGTGSYWTKSAINTRASGSANIAAAQLESAVAELSSILDEGEIVALTRSQAAWALFRDEHADFAALECMGGSMEQLLRSSEKEALSMQRLAQLRTTIEERRKRND